MSFRIVRTDTVTYLASDLLTAPHAFSTRLGGVSTLPHTATLNLAFGRGDERETVLENLNRFAAAVGFDSDSTVATHQIHGCIVHPVDHRHRGVGFARPSTFEGDGFVTHDPSVTLAVKTADCTPILLEALVAECPVAVSALHAGWRGTVADIAGVGVRSLRELACAQAGVSADAVTVRAAIGPCIHACCLEVREDCLAVVRDSLGAMAEPFIRQTGARTCLDIPALNRALLIRVGVDETNVDTCDLCTACHPELFYSHRASGGVRGTLLNVIRCP